MRALSILLIGLLLSAPAQAGLSRADIARVGVSLPPAARIDPALAAPDAEGTRRRMGDILAGHPAFLIFVDYTCTTLCGTELALLANALQRARLGPSEMRILVLGIDPRDEASAARDMETKELPPLLRSAAAFLLPDKATVAATTEALGFRYVFDEESDQFAHPAAIYLLSPKGRVTGVLSPFDLLTQDLRSRLSDASPSLYERVRLLCYGLDPATGLYNARIATLLKSIALLTLLLLGAAILLFARGRRRVG